MKPKIGGVLLAFLASIPVATLWAHHSPSAIFDMTKRVTFTGTLTKVDWINPHIVVYMDAATGGKTEAWQWESNPPAWFKRVGVGKADLSKFVGQTVKIEGVRAKDGALYGYMQKITFADGSSLELLNGADAK